MHVHVHTCTFYTGVYKCRNNKHVHDKLAHRPTDKNRITLQCTKKIKSKNPWKTPSVDIHVRTIDCTFSHRKFSRTKRPAASYAVKTLMIILPADFLSLPRDRFIINNNGIDLQLLTMVAWRALQAQAGGQSIKQIDAAARRSSNSSRSHWSISDMRVKVLDVAASAGNQQCHHTLTSSRVQ